MYENFVNRLEERKIIKEVCSEIRNGQSNTIWIEGKEGVGKTYLVQKIVNEVEEVFFYSNNSPIYKCNKNNHITEFAFIADILISLKIKYPKKFDKIVTEYYNHIESISIKESIFMFFSEIPKLNYIKTLVNNHTKYITEGKAFVRSKMETGQLITCFVDIILGILSYGDMKNVVFCIDDIIWMDKESFQTLDALLSRNFYTKDINHKVNLSFFITTRSKKTLDLVEEQQYVELYKLLSEYTNNIKVFEIENFSRKYTLQLIQQEKRFLLEEHVDEIYEITKGNPFDLSYTLKCTDTNVLSKVIDHKNKSRLGDEHYFSENLIMTLQKDNDYIIPIISILSIIEFKISTEILVELFRCAYSKINLNTFYKALYILVEVNIITCTHNSYSVTHDIMKSIMKDYLHECGEYNAIANCIADRLLNFHYEYKEFHIATRISIALDILSKVNPVKGFESFIDIINGEYLLSQDIIVSAAKCFCFHNQNFTNKEYVNNYAVNIVLNSLVEYGNLAVAKQISDILFKDLFLLKSDIKIMFLSCYTKILIDLGLFDQDRDNNIYGANQVFEQLINAETLDDNDKFNKYLLGMSLYEHQGMIKKIEEYHNKASQMLDKHSISNELKAKYYRNQGLVKFHADLEVEYKNAIYFAKKIKNEKKRELVLGTCYNNLGLCRFYSGDIELALETFKMSKELLLSADYELVRVINNISICELLLGNIQEAYDQIIKAKTQPMKGVFEEASVDINLSLIHWKTGDKDSALEIVNSYISEYNNKDARTKDGWIYSGAMLNKGYYEYCSDNFLSAIQYFRDSNFYTSRFADELEKKKRDQMINICLKKNNIHTLYFENNKCIIDENAENYYCLPFTVDLLAFYVI